MSAKVVRTGLTISPIATYLNEKGMFGVKVRLAESKAHSDKRDAVKELEMGRIRKGEGMGPFLSTLTGESGSRREQQGLRLIARFWGTA